MLMPKLRRAGLLLVTRIDTKDIRVRFNRKMSRLSMMRRCSVVHMVQDCW